MDAFLAICQGLGLAIAAGLVIAVIVPPIMPTWGVVAGSAPLGVLGAGAALNGADVALWPAIPIGIAGSGLAAALARPVVAGAARRQRGGEADTRLEPIPAGLVALVVMVAAVVAVASYFLPPASLVALAGFAWLGLARRRRDARKHEGLRVLR